MPLTQLYTRAQVGIDAPEVRVEVHLSGGLPAFHVVGLPETAVREARDRVRSAILNTGFEFPAQRITVNLAPADLPKSGGRYDLPIALGILGASAQIDRRPLAAVDCYGELALSGECRRVDGLLPALIASRTAGRAVVVPDANRGETALVAALDARLANSLHAVCASLNGGDSLPAISPSPPVLPVRSELDLADVRGQAQARRALEIAACGGHHLLLVGPPGCGKSMLAQRMPTMLPPLDDDEALQSASIRSICGLPIDTGRWRARPFRAPHHTVSAIALAGGGSHPRPGEISLAHNGVLFLDELTEFDRRALEVLREPLETGRIHIARAARQAVFPARFQLVAAMNPCPGGCESIATCNCTPEQLGRYRHKLSAPWLDRVDLRIELARVEPAEIVASRTPRAETSAQVRVRVVAARERQLERQGRVNARLSPCDLSRFCALDPTGEEILNRAHDRFRLSARSYHNLLRVARSIADLTGSAGIEAAHIGEALAYRALERVAGESGN